MRPINPFGWASCWKKMEHGSSEQKSLSNVGLKCARSSSSAQELVIRSVISNDVISIGCIRCNMLLPRIIHSRTHVRLSYIKPPQYHSDAQIFTFLKVFSSSSRSVAHSFFFFLSSLFFLPSHSFDRVVKCIYE